MDNLSQDQLQAMLKMSKMTPTQSSTALSHSNNLLTKVINGAEGLLPTAGAVLGGLGGAAIGGAAGIETGPGALATGFAGGVVGSGVGASAGEALREKLQGENFQGGKIAIEGVTNAALEAVGGPLANIGGKVLEKTALPVISTIGKGIAKVGEMFGGKPAADMVTGQTAKATTKKVASTAETMTKGERISAIKEGRQVPTMTGGGKYLPSDTEKRAGELLQGKLSANPVKNVPVVKSEIATRGQEAEQYLGQNGKPISNEEDFEMFKKAREDVSKYLSTSQLNGYDHAVSQFQSELKGMGNMNTATYYKALKNFESNVTENLPRGKEAILSDTVSGQLVGAKTVRSAVRDMIGSKNPEFKGKMFDIASLYDALDNVAAKAERVGSFGKRHPAVKKTFQYAGGGAAGAIGAGAVYEGGKDILGQ